MKFKNTPEQKIFWGSDFHLLHDPKWDTPIWKSRGFNSAQEACEWKLGILNEQVRPEDILIYHGDFSLNSTVEQVKDLFRRINCDNIYYLSGNHESSVRKIFQEAEIWKEIHMKVLKKWENVIFAGEHLEYTVNGQYIVSSHFPMLDWNHIRNSWHVSGHEHGEMPESQVRATDGKIIDCGIEVVLDYSKRNKVVFDFDDLCAIMSRKQSKLVGHH